MIAHSRTEQGKQRQEARRYVITTSFQDVKLAETVCLVTSEDVMEHLAQSFPLVVPSACVHYEKGLVLTDSRGRGFMQK